MNDITFKPGELFVYKNGRRCELGIVKRYIPADAGGEDHYACYYNLGETASRTPVSCMYKLENYYCIGAVGIGGTTTVINKDIDERTYFD